ncbi:hypothetical protein S2M10_22690 [Sphingomonas sp. S2M10]|uniref:hypothetical protein n=1 Tax=Sphingomonas sp. S2M10 TaxID=2705010 RepID=UPI001693E542|nr:hypothetical protein [Sphingomonas sp. S2M10]NLS27274.1 hypothetical protein [Sphingomonas sp. S2M10]
MTMARGKHRPGELPWGWWLRINGDQLEDEQGRRWRSVRDAFWHSEIGFGDMPLQSHLLELMLRVLVSADTQRQGPKEKLYELFGSDRSFWYFYMCWLLSIGLLTRENPMGVPFGILDARISPEGRSVLLMLIATRDPEWEHLTMAEVVDTVMCRSSNAADREAALRAFERSLGVRRHVFARETIGRSHVITLTGLQAGHPARMPTRRVTWSLSFDSRAIRDDLFAWIATRVEHWDYWGDLAYRKGAEALTQHLLGSAMASRTEQS